jgi:hypothetical protein
MTDTITVYECSAYRLETHVANAQIEAGSPQQAMEKLRQMESSGDLSFDDYSCDSECAHAFYVKTGDHGELEHVESPNIHTLRELVRELAEALEAQAMADADPEASRRKGYFDRARDMRRAALTKAGRIAW